jgi:aconitate hydratase
MWRDDFSPDPVFTDTLELDLSTVEPSMAGPKRPQDRVALLPAPSTRTSPPAPKGYKKPGDERQARAGRRRQFRPRPWRRGDRRDHLSCTNTSNPSVLVAAGLVARKARAQGPDRQALGQDLAGAGHPGRHRLSEGRPAPRISTRSASTGRLWLHHLHRQFRPAAGADGQGDQRQRAGRRLACSRATATSRAASPTCAPTSSPRRRWSSPMRWPGAIDITTSRSAPARTASRSMLKDIWPTNQEVADTDQAS